tara:strand:- start:469 stop:1398 length:930 start_codon:yes stop_codon:yes gene_type:complete
MVIAVIGASGFIGLQLVNKLLKNGHDIRVLSRKNSFPLDNVNHFKGDLLCSNFDFNKFLKNVDILYNCSGNLHHENLMYDLHVVAIENLLKISVGNIKKWIQLGSVGSYGLLSKLDINESCTEHPTNIYERTKTLSDNLVKKSGIPYVIVRPSNIFGKTMTNQSLFQLMKIIKSGCYFHIGCKDSVVNYVHIDDVINGLIECGINDAALNNVFIISQFTKTTNMITSFKNGMGINRRHLHMSENFVRTCSKLISLFYKSFPLTEARIDALTYKKVYKSEKILNNLNFEFIKSLDDRLLEFAQEVKHSQR